MAKKKSKKSKKETVAQNVVKIKIWQRFGSDVKHLRSEYEARESKDGYGNPVVLNEKRGHNEDFGFTQDDVYSSLMITYNVEGKDKTEVIKSIETNMIKTKARIEALEEFPELSIFANVWDEKEKLEQLRIFKKYISYHSENGSYYTEEHGIRVYDFEGTDGFLVPVWHDADNLVDFTDYTYNKKVTMQETAELKIFLDAKKRQNIKYASLFMILIINMVVLGILIFGTVKVLNYHNEAVARWEEPANYCANQNALVVGTMTNLLNNEVVKNCLLNNNQSKLIDDVTSKVKALDTNK
jgi:large-conductance mechanosensitive channel